MGAEAEAHRDGGEPAAANSLFCSLEVYSEPDTVRGRCILNISARQPEGPIAGLPKFLRRAAAHKGEVLDEPG